MRTAQGNIATRHRRWRVAGVIMLALAQTLAIAGCAPSLEVERSGATSALSTPAVARLTAAGIGSIGAGSPYAQTAFRQALPEFEFQTVKMTSEGEFKWLVAAFKHGSQQLQFEADRSGKKVGRIHVVGLEAEGPNGERLGMSFAETGGAALNCRPGLEEWSGMAVCESTDRLLAYVYAPQSYAGPDGRLPPPRELAGARLVRIVWRAPRD